MSDSEERPSYILDTSFMRGASSDGRQIRALADRGYRPVLIDNPATGSCAFCKATPAE